MGVAFSMQKYLGYRMATSSTAVLLNPVVTTAVVMVGAAALLEEMLDPMRPRYNYVPE